MCTGNKFILYTIFLKSNGYWGEGECPSLEENLLGHWGKIDIGRGVLFSIGFWETNQLSPDKGLAILNNMNIWSFILSVLKNARNRSYRQMSITNNMEILKEKLINALIIQRQLQVKVFYSLMNNSKWKLSFRERRPRMSCCWDKILDRVNQ